MSPRLFSATPRGDGVVGLCIATDDEPYLGAGWVESFCDGLAHIAQSQDVRAVVLEGGVRHFCAGAALHALLDVGNGVAVPAYGARAARVLLDLPVPVVAAAAGHATGGGLMLALWCDAAVLAAESLYGANFMALGLTPGMGATHVMQEAFGASLGRELLFSGRLMTGREIAQACCPLSHAVRPRDRVLAQAYGLATGMADAPRNALVLLKRSLVSQRAEALARVLDEENAAHARLFADPATRAEIARRYPRAPLAPREENE